MSGPEPSVLAAAGGPDEARERGRALLLVCAAQFVLQLDFSIVNVALPTIERELHIVAANLQWIVTGYALTFGSLLLLGGRVGDLVGHRRLMLIGLVLFGVTSLSAGLAPNAAVLIASRFAQGASAAFVAPMTLATVTDLFEEGPTRSRAFGIFQGATAAGASAGIVLGGILTQFIGWRSIFLVNPPIIAVLIVLMLRLLARDARHQNARLDVVGAVLATVAIASLIFGLSQGQQHGFTKPTTLSALIVALVLGTTFVVVERRIAAPMVPFRVLVDRTRRAALSAMLLMGAVLAGYVYFTSLYLQRVLHLSALLTGIGLVPATGTVMLTSTLLTRRLLARFGAKWLLLAGLTSTGLGQLWLSHVTTTGSYEVNVLAGLVLTAFGIGLVFPTASVAVTAGMPPSERGLAGAMFATALQVGQALGLAALATIAAARTKALHNSLVAGYRLSYLVAVGIVVLALGIVLFALRTPRSAEAVAPVEPASATN